MHQQRANPRFNKSERKKTKGKLRRPNGNTGKVLIKFYDRKWNKIVTLCIVSNWKHCVVFVIEVAIFVQHILTNLLDFIWFCPCPVRTVEWQVNTPVTSSTHQKFDTMMMKSRHSLYIHSFTTLVVGSLWLLVIIIKVTRYLFSHFCHELLLWQSRECLWEWNAFAQSW